MAKSLFRLAVLGFRSQQWTVIGPPELIGKYRYVLCRCDCGKETRLLASAIVQGQVRGCRDCSDRRRTKHGESLGGTMTPEYRTWQSIRQRCGNHRNRGYPNYGGRGIRVCDRWQTFEHFLADMGRRPSSKHTIERNDVNGPYSPENCRWATMLEQGNNRREHVFIEYQGERDTLANWARRLGINPITLGKRLQAGWSVDQALTEPVVPRRKGVPRQTRR